MHLLAYKRKWQWWLRRTVCYICGGLHIHILQKMLEYEQAKRIPAKKALEHPYFNDVRKEMH